MTQPVCELVITADDEPWLLSFTRSLVNDRLAACGQMVGPIRSIYRWDNAVQDEAEVRVAPVSYTHLTLPTTPYV